MYITIYWWTIPAVVTVVSIIWSLFFVRSENAWFGPMPNILALLISGWISAAAWALAGFLR